MWNEEVNKLAASVDKTTPTEVAFGRATKRNIQNAINNLVARGVTEVVAVPLFISSQALSLPRPDTCPVCKRARRLSLPYTRRWLTAMAGISMPRHSQARLGLTHPRRSNNLSLSA